MHKEIRDELGSLTHSLEPISILEARTRYKSSVSASTFPLHLSAHPTNSLLLSGSTDHSINLLDISRENYITSQRIFTDNGWGKINHLKWVNAGADFHNIFISAFQEGTLAIWDVRHKDPVKLISRPGASFGTIASNSIYFAAALSHNIILWDLRKMKIITELRDSHSEEVTGLEFNSYDQQMLLSCGQDNLMCLFNLSTPSETDALQTVISSSQPLEQCGFHIDQKNKLCLWARTNIETVEIYEVTEDNIDLLYLINAQQLSLPVKYLLSLHSPTFGKLYLPVGNNKGEVYILELFPREKRYKIIGVCSDNREGKEVTINCSEDNAPIVRCLQFVSGNDLFLSNEQGEIILYKESKETTTLFNIESRNAFSSSNATLEQIAEDDLNILYRGEDQLGPIKKKKKGRGDKRKGAFKPY